VSWSLGGRPIRSVLLTRLRYLGDIVMSTVLVEVLRRGDPDLRIGYLCEDGHASVLNGHQGIDRLHRLRTTRLGSDAKARAQGMSQTSNSRSTLGTIFDLRGESYDLAVDLFFNPRSAWLLKLAGIPLRIGGTRKSRGALYTHRVIRKEVTAENADFNRVAPGGLGEHLCRLAPLTHVESGQAFVDWLPSQFGPGDLKPILAQLDEWPLAREGLAGVGIKPGSDYLLLAPCATWPSKEWPAARWGELVSLLLDRTNLPLAVLTAPGREGDWKGLADRIPRIRGGVMPALPLPEALAVTCSSRALLTVDGGIMHAAVGFGVPTLALFGPTDPKIWFPYAGSGPFRVLARAPHCHPCDLHECREFICLPDLESATVLDSLDSLMTENDPFGGRQP
jgi:ADP-heptose:LPS heptosyltransferase